MAPNNDVDYDRRLRAPLEPEPATVDRLVRGALSQPARRRFTGSGLYRGALLLAAVTGLVWLFAHLQGPDSKIPDQFGLESVGAVILLQAPSGESWILTAGKSAVTLPPGMGLVIIEGESK